MDGVSVIEGVNDGVWVGVIDGVSVIEGVSDGVLVGVIVGVSVTVGVLLGVDVFVAVAVSVCVGVNVEVAVEVFVAVEVLVGFGVLVCGGVPITSSLLMTVLAEVDVIGISGKLKKCTIGSYSVVTETTTRSPDSSSCGIGQTALIGSTAPLLSGPWS